MTEDTDHTAYLDAVILFELAVTYKDRMRKSIVTETFFVTDYSCLQNKKGMLTVSYCIRSHTNIILETMTIAEAYHVCGYIKNRHLHEAYSEKQSATVN